MANQQIKDSLFASQQKETAESSNSLVVADEQLSRFIDQKLDERENRQNENMKEFFASAFKSFQESSRNPIILMTLEKIRSLDHPVLLIIPRILERAEAKAGNENMPAVVSQVKIVICQ